MDDALGPGYDYWKSIKSPNELGMSDEGTIKALSNDISGLLDYVSVLVTGNSNASVTGGPLGNKFFLKTMATCKNVEADPNLPDSETNPIVVPRYIYVDNVPDGTIPFIPTGPDGGKLKDFRGLIPGAIGNLAAFSPSGFGRAFTMGNHPDCINIALETVDNDNNYGQETHYVAVADIMNEIKSSNMKNGNPVGNVKDPCRFKDYTNPATNAKKTKAECEPKDKDEFTLLRQSNIGGGGYYGTDDSDSDSDSDSSSDSESTESNESNIKKREKKKESARLKKIRKQQKRDKKMHEEYARAGSNVLMSAGATQQYVPENNTRSSYDILSINNDTMFDDVHILNGMQYKQHKEKQQFRLPDDTASRIYYTAITGIGLYLLYRLMWKRVKR
jgi:hypothetical protein